MNQNRFGLSALTWIAFLCSSCEAQTVFNPTTEMSVTNGNPNGVWIYGWMNTGFTTFNAFANSISDSETKGWYGNYADKAPTAYVNVAEVSRNGVPAGYLSLHPGDNNEPALLRWTAPSGFTSVEAVGQFLAGASGVMQVGVRKNGTWLWNASDAGSFNLSTSLVAGDTIDFAVYGGYGNGNTPLELTITAIPEPSTCAALAGLAALGAAIWRQRLKDNRITIRG